MVISDVDELMVLYGAGAMRRRDIVGGEGVASCGMPDDG